MWSTEVERIVEAYKTMATKIRYRPVWIDPHQVTEAELNEEAHVYAKEFIRQEDKCEFHIGCADWHTNRALVYLIEAARSICGVQNDLALDLIKLAVVDIKAAVKNGKHT